MPLISVIVPVYKAEPYIEACVASILNQTYRDFELILVEDGSPDRSGEICDALARTDSRIRVLHKANGGAATARNAGLDTAKGKYIAFIDGDDVIHQEYLQFLVWLLEKHDADIAMCHYDFFTEEGVWSNESPDMAAEVTLVTGAEILQDFSNHCYRMRMISMCMKIFRKEIFDDLRLPVGSTEEDSIILPHIMERSGRIVQHQAKLYHWRVTPGSVSRSGLSSKSFHRIEISRLAAEFFIKRKNTKQANHFKTMFLRRTMRYYYRVKDENPSLMPDFIPYLRQYRKLFIRYFLSGGMCKRERIAYALFLVCTPKARGFLEAVYGPKDL